MLQDGQTVIPWVEAMSAKSEEQIRPNLANLRIYGCAAWVRDRHLAKKDKMASRAQLGYLKIWFPATGVLATIPTIDLWRIAPKEVEYEESSDEENIRYPRRDPESLSKDAGKPSPAKTPEPIFWPIPENTPMLPIGQERTITEVPGAFPEEPLEGSDTAFRPPASLAEGVRIPISIAEIGPEDQLNSELYEAIQTDPLEGYRERGSIAPRDISATLTESNIVTGKRTRKRPKHFDAMIATKYGEQEEDSHEGLLLAFKVAMASLIDQDRLMRDDLLPEPKRRQEMLSHPHHAGFIKAAELEIETLKRKGTFVQTERPRDRSVQILPLKWVFAYKFDENGLLTKHKARICVRGDLQKVSMDEKYSATLAVRTARFVFVLAAHFDLDMSQWDAVNAFLNSTLPQHVYVDLPPGLYPNHRGQQEASRVLKSLGFCVVDEDLCLFVRDGIIIIFYVDDLIMLNHKGQRKEAADVAKSLNKAWELAQ
ncbi:uncharacterized protein N7458_008740 [Penicillium daleae]|uniref:Reverse transcriptase Ty1/copia-type domain-containing protein n=1 Tax=Penicillium daleae TaxID=63821 RepID=A0AAD6FYP2_9EURO|nr:uncharacterized protein N7458_008740 [Penicillium daleae]KAJ5437742.1 hypothetical protein N7458_008740 [Penicillium daleae]